MDLSQMSDADLEAISKNDLKSVSDHGLELMHAQSTPPPPAAPPQEDGWIKQLGRSAVDSLPMMGGVVGGAVGATAGLGIGSVPGAVGGSALGYGTGQAAKDLLNKYIDPERAPKTVGDQFSSIGKSIPVGAAQEMGGQILGEGVGLAAGSKYIKPYLDEAGQLIVNGFNKAGKYVGDAAEKMAVAATGATGMQARQFAPGTGRALLDNGIVGFGRSQAGIGEAAQNVLGQQGDIIQSTIADLTKQGAAGTKTDLVAGIQAKIDELGTDPAQAQVVKQLEGLKADVAAGPDAPNLSQIEQTKRGFQSMVNYANPEGNAAKAAAADVYKNAAEKVAQNTDPLAAQQFMDAKKLYGQIAPVANAAEKRAFQVQQSPTGGLGDMAAAAAGGAPMVIAKKTIFPRVNSSMASTANSLSQIITKTPEVFGKWAPALTAAAARGETSLNAADYVLQQTDPGYRQKRKDLNNQGSDSLNQNLSSSDDQ